MNKRNNRFFDRKRSERYNMDKDQCKNASREEELHNAANPEENTDNDIAGEATQAPEQENSANAPSERSPRSYAMRERMCSRGFSR